jgi:hypothetical protein
MQSPFSLLDVATVYTTFYGIAALRRYSASQDFFWRRSLDKLLRSALEPLVVKTADSSPEFAKELNFYDFLYYLFKNYDFLLFVT